MYKFSKRSLTNLNSCHMDLKTIAMYAIEHVDFAVIHGYRNKIDQNILFDSGFSKVEYPNSKHNKKPSMAFDILPYQNNKPISWDDKSSFYYVAGTLIGISIVLYNQGLIKHKLRFGGDWDKDGDINDNDFKDLGHFELV